MFPLEGFPDPPICPLSRRGCPSASVPRLFASLPLDVAAASAVVAAPGGHVV